jgi:hypothetical protein
VNCGRISFFWRPFFVVGLPFCASKNHSLTDGRPSTLAEFIDVPDSAREPKPLFPDLPGFALVREVREWVSTNPTYMWRGHTHTMPGKTEPVEFVGMFEMPRGVEAPCPCCTPNHTKFRFGVVGWFPETGFIRLMGTHCFRRLNPEGFELAVRRLEERQGRASTIAFLLANLHKKGDAKRAAWLALPLAEHLDDLQYQLGERVRQMLGIDLWQAVRDGGQLKLAAGTGRSAVNTNYATVSGYRLVDPARKKLTPRLEAALKAFDAIPHFDIPTANDAERSNAARLFGKGLNLLREALEDIDELRRFVSVQSTATIRNWSLQDNAPAQIYMRREGQSVFIGETEDQAREIRLKPVVDAPIPSLPVIVTTS